MAGGTLMLGGSSKPIIVYVDRSRLQFYGGKLSSIAVMDIPATLVSDLEVINRDGLYTLVGGWMKQNSLGGSRLFFILSPSTYFEKMITAMTETEQETEILKFYDMVPFEELLTKVISGAVPGQKWAFATNSAFIEALRHAFLLQGIRVIGVVPALLLGSLAAKRWMDAEMGAYVVKHVDVLKEQTVVDSDEFQAPLPGTPQSMPTAANNPRLMILVSVFGVLLLGFILFLFLHH
jgi:hypothetical protein